MIRYRLECGAGHAFEAWFASSDAYDKQEAAGSVRCPMCGDARVRKALMAPSIASGRGKPSSDGEPASAPPASAPPASENAPAGERLGPPPEKVREMFQTLRAMRDQVLAKSEYVGPRFAEEARRIHFEEAPERLIHGEASREEVEALAEDGIDVMPVPRLPDDLS